MKKLLFGAVVLALVLVPAALANQSQSRFSLTLKVIGPGTVMVSPGTKCAGYLTRTHACKTIYVAGTKVRLTASPKVDMKLSSWRGSISGKTSVKVFTMNAPKVITATFVKVPVSPAPTPAPAPAPTPAPAPAPPARVTLNFNGSGLLDLAPFTLPVGENLCWTSSWPDGAAIGDPNGDFAINDNTTAEFLVDANNTASGCTYISAGPHQLWVNAEGSWTITIS
jgi:Divergent InlB B-repeat domain